MPKCELKASIFLSISTPLIAWASCTQISTLGTYIFAAKWQSLQVVTVYYATSQVNYIREHINIFSALKVEPSPVSGPVVLSSSPVQ